MTLVRPVLLYRSEACKVTRAEEKKMDVFQHRSIRKTPNIRWEQKIEIEEIRM
jgi:hypothetical protein